MVKHLLVHWELEREYLNMLYSNLPSPMYDSGSIGYPALMLACGLFLISG